jgi:hypothetical protein
MKAFLIHQYTFSYLSQQTELKHSILFSFLCYYWEYFDCWLNYISHSFDSLTLEAFYLIIINIPFPQVIKEKPSTCFPAFWKCWQSIRYINWCALLGFSLMTKAPCLKKNKNENYKNASDIASLFYQIWRHCWWPTSLTCARDSLLLVIYSTGDALCFCFQPH